MGIYKAVKLEVLILTNASEDTTDVRQCVEDAMHDYCQYLGTVVKVMSEYETVVARLDEEGEAKA